MTSSALVVTILVLAAVALSGCNSDPSSSTPLTQRQYLARTPMPDQRAEDAAMILSRQIVAPVELYERIHRDLQLIENRYGHRYPLRGIPFFLSWYPGVLDIKVSLEFEADSLHPGRHIIDSLNDLYNLRIDHVFDRWYGVGGVRRYNAVRLTEQYAIVPGIEILGPVAIPFPDGIPSSPCFWVLPGRYVYKYFFYFGVEEQDPYRVTDNLLYFEVASNRVILRGEWSDDALNPSGNRPSWFLTLRMAQYESLYSATWSSTGGFSCDPEGACTPR